MLRHLGLTAESERVLRLATQLGAGDIDAVRRLAGELRRRRSLWWATADVGVVGIDGGVGPIGRAAGAAVDARLDAPSYDGLGFAPIPGTGEADSPGRVPAPLVEALQRLGSAAGPGSVGRDMYMNGGR